MLSSSFIALLFGLSTTLCSILVASGSEQAHPLHKDDPDYYASIDPNARGEVLRAQLTALIAPHKVLSYGALWSAFVELDRLGGNRSACSAGTLADIFSATCWVPVQQQCGNFRREGDCYNREHSFPKSWWGGATSSAAYTDLFHLFPADGYDNNRRGNDPLGTVNENAVIYRTSDGGMLGTCASSQAGGGRCYEPADQWKGVMARAMFYVSVAYRDQFTCCASPATNGAVLKTWWARELLTWHESFPVSALEKKRNEAVFAHFQGNRNPFIDHPEWVARVFAP